MAGRGLDFRLDRKVDGNPERTGLHGVDHGCFQLCLGDIKGIAQHDDLHLAVAAAGRRVASNGSYWWAWSTLDTVTPVHAVKTASTAMVRGSFVGKRSLLSIIETPGLRD
jgi:hypothetical protein